MGLHKIFPQDNTGVPDLAPLLVQEHGVEVHLVHVRVIDGELAHLEEQGLDRREVRLGDAPVAVQQREPLDLVHHLVGVKVRDPYK